ncbi:hypothetical protein FRC12_008467 [Ceratobasidium sp. 428]|nr:hypothetical protein FRC12_008467 [Ceratobasidium sp. 428]
MSTPPVSTPTSGSSPNAAQWPSVSSSRSVYTYSFLAAIGFLTIIVLFFMGRSYTRRRRFAIRVQQALDSGRLDPAIADEIMSLPAGALYFARSKRTRKNKVKPSMYQVRLGEVGCGRPSVGNDHDQAEEWLMDWEEIMLRSSPTPDKLAQPEARQPPRSPLPSPHSNIYNSSEPGPPNFPTPSPSVSRTMVSPKDCLTLSVFIAMPSPIAKSYGDEDMEGMIPDVCFGIAQVDVAEQARC